MGESWEDIIEESGTYKDLFRLIIRQGQVRVDEAPRILNVPAEKVTSWGALLAERGLAVIDADGQTYRLSDSMRAKIDGYRKLKAIGDPKDVLAAVKSDLARERQRTAALEAKVADKGQIIDGLRAEMVSDRKALEELKSRLKSIEDAGREDESSAPAKLEVKLQRERAERMKLEEALRLKHEELEALRGKAKPRAEAAEAQAASGGGDGWAKITALKEKIAKAKKEFGALDGRASEAAIISEEEDIERLLEEEAALLWGGKQEERTADAKAQAPKRSWSQVLKPTEAPESSRNPVKEPDSRPRMKVQGPKEMDPRYAASPEGKDASDLLKLLSEKGRMKEKAAAKELGVDEKKLVGWVSALVSEGAVAVRVHMFGGSDVGLRDGVDLEAMMQKVQANRMREELSNFREAR